jgi:protein tyrosine phosphatase
MAEDWALWLVGPVFVLLLALCAAKKKKEKEPERNVVDELEAAAEQGTAQTSLASIHPPPPASLPTSNASVVNESAQLRRFSELSMPATFSDTEQGGFLAFDPSLGATPFGESSLDFSAFGVGGDVGGAVIGDGAAFNDFGFLASFPDTSQGEKTKTHVLEGMGAADLDLGYDYVSAPTMDFGQLGDASTDQIYAEAVDHSSRFLKNPDGSTIPLPPARPESTLSAQSGPLVPPPRQTSSDSSGARPPILPPSASESLVEPANGYAYAPVTAPATPSSVVVTPPLRSPAAPPAAPPAQDEDVYVDLNKDAQAKQTARLSMSFVPSAQGGFSAVKEAARQAAAKLNSPAPPQPVLSEMYEDMQAPKQSAIPPRSALGATDPLRRPETNNTTMQVPGAVEESTYTAMGALPQQAQSAASAGDSMYTAMASPAPSTQSAYTPFTPTALGSPKLASASIGLYKQYPGNAVVAAPVQEDYVDMKDANIPQQQQQGARYEDVDIKPPRAGMGNASSGAGSAGTSRRNTFDRSESGVSSSSTAAGPAGKGSGHSYVNLSVGGNEHHPAGFIPPSTGSTKRGGASHSYVNTTDGQTPLPAANATGLANGGSAASQRNSAMAGEPSYGNLGPGGAPLITPKPAAAGGAAASPSAKPRVSVTIEDGYSSLLPAKPATASSAPSAAASKANAASTSALSRTSSLSAQASASRTPSKAATQEWLIAPKDTERYKALSQNKQPVSAVPAFARNKTFNRHLDVLPNPATRVPLAPYGNDETSTYINANFIKDGLGNTKAYICTQAPLDLTLTHFWRMVWDHNVHHIVMSTNLFEKGEEKSIQYWPDEPGLSLPIQDFQITLSDVIPSQGYVCNVLDMEYDGETRRIHHWWFKAWPDHGVPRSEGRPDPSDCVNMLAAIRRRRASLGQVDDPVLMHCSAGVGRSGAMVAMDICMKHLESIGHVDPTRIVRMMREDRVALVQHPQQYELVHAACHFFAQNVAQHACRDDPSATEP